MYGKEFALALFTAVKGQAEASVVVNYPPRSISKVADKDESTISTV